MAAELKGEAERGSAIEGQNGPKNKGDGTPSGTARRQRVRDNRGRKEKMRARAETKKV